MKSAKIKKFDELSKDIEDKDLEMDIEKVKSGEYEIESIIDVFRDPKDIPESLRENVVITGVNLTDGIKRGDTIYISCLMKKKGSSISSPASSHVLRVRIIDIYHGLSYLNKILKD